MQLSTYICQLIWSGFLISHFVSYTYREKNFVRHFASFVHNANFKFHKKTNYHFYYKYFLQ